MTRDLLLTQTVGHIVARDGRTASVFSRHGIDFCCGGRQTLTEACVSKHLDADEIVRELTYATAASEADVDVTGWSATRLIEWIVARHHTYVRAEIPAITALLDKTAGRHSAAHPELAEMRARFSIAADDLTRHMVKEERILFPTLAWLDARPDSTSNPCPLSVDHAMAVMRAEHEEAALQLSQIRRLANGYVAPPDACNTWKAAYAQLEAFEADLHRHVHLENEVLFPLAERLAHRARPGEAASSRTH